MDEPPVDQTTTAEPDRPTGGWVVPPPPPPRSGRKKAGIVAGLAVLLAIPGVKLLSTLLAASVASAAFSSAFGGPFEKLPADFRSGVETRLKAIAPADFDQRSDTERDAWIMDQSKGGLARLDDATLVRRWQLMRAAFGQMSVAACAASMREMANGATASRASSDAFLTALDMEQRKDWVEITLEAMEAQAHEIPVRATVSEREFNRISASIDDLSTIAELNAMQAYGDGTTPSDAVVCSGFRAYIAVAARLPPADLAIVALYEVQP